MRRLKKQDMVMVISGNEKGKKGKILEILSDDKVIVEKINIVSKCKKPTNESKGGIFKVPAGIHKSNLMLILDDKPTRVNYETNAKTKKKFRKGKSK